MARPREFDEDEVLDAAAARFWAHGYGATSVRDLVEATGVTCASLYNAFGDKRALFDLALGRYVARSLDARLDRCRGLPPRAAIGAFFDDILARSLDDPERRGCLVVNAALEVAPHDAALCRAISAVLGEIEGFFLDCARAGQAAGEIATALPAEDLARHLLALLMGLRVLARVRPEADLLQGALRAGLAPLDPPQGGFAAG